MPTGEAVSTRRPVTSGGEEDLELSVRSQAQAITRAAKVLAHGRDESHATWSPVAPEPDMIESRAWLAWLVAWERTTRRERVPFRRVIGFCCYTPDGPSLPRDNLLHLQK